MDFSPVHFKGQTQRAFETSKTTSQKYCCRLSSGILRKELRYISHLYCERRIATDTKLEVMHFQASECLQITSFRAPVPFKAVNLGRSRRASISLICQQTEYSTGISRRETVNIAAIAAIVLPGLALLHSSEAQAIGYKNTAA